MKIFITGGCGFVGSNLSAFLRQQGHDITVFDNLSRGSRDFITDPNISIIEGDIRNLEQLLDAMQGMDYVIHLAAYGSVVESISDPETNFDINAYGTLQVLEAARRCKVKKLVFASTGGALIGNAPPPVNEKSIPKPVSPYGASKLVGEGYCNAYAGSYDLQTVILRFGNIYGPVSAHKKGAITVFCKALLQDESFVIYGDGQASRDFLHVSDLCRGITSSLETDLPPATVMHLATGRETTVFELADILRKAAGKPEHVIEYRDMRAGEVLRNFASCDEARHLIDFNPEITLESGLEETWKWFESLGDEALKIEATDS